MLEIMIRRMKAVKATAALARHLLKPGFAREWLLAGWHREAEGKAPLIDLADTYPGADRLSVDLGTVRYLKWNMDPTERFVLGMLAQICQPRRIFEIGTFDGAATLVLAMNAPDAMIDTLDLHPDDPRSAAARGEIGAAGEQLEGRPERDRIRQHYVGPDGFDFAPWAGCVDLVLVDAGHLYEEVREDTARALGMLSDAGLVIWDDYTRTWPGVVKAVDETRLPVFRIRGTEMAVYDRGLRGLCGSDQQRGRPGSSKGGRGINDSAAPPPRQ
jgi:predicted O-methyltransferase YrrM